MTLQLSLFFVIVCFISLLCFASSLRRDESDYGCFVFVECPPEEEVKPCIESNGFYCTRCLPGYVQPTYVTSNQHNNTCFKPKSLTVCVAEDVTYSRTEQNTFCDSLDGCKCNTNKCYYGDPCLCNLHTPGCPVNTSLDENGVCQPCDAGTAKNDTGCGPCRAVFQKSHSIHVNVITMTPEKRLSMSTMETTKISSMEEGKRDITSKTNAICMERTTFVVLAICFAILVIFVIIITIVLCWLRKQCCFAKDSTVISNGNLPANGEETMSLT
ncbi:uncharacterized protein LOC134693314 [Mytilus trossulus]|uniref:uncharacterized protein LOC134693314 n=1 Tax=Mytilus trossulus TaxID=6551 RepID=UPI003005A2D8